MSDKKIKTFDDWLEVYAESGIHLEGLTPCQYGQSVWASMEKQLEKAKDESEWQYQELLGGRKEISQLKKQLEAANEKIDRFKITLKTLCTCSDGGVNNLVFCQACKFKESFN